MKLAIADPPYLGRADRWYGAGRGSGRVITSGGRPGRKPDFHPDAARWDRFDSHRLLMVDLAADYDGWAIAGTADSGPKLLRWAPEGTRMGIWARTNAMPAGARVINTYETVVYFIPPERRNRVKGESVRDVLVSAHGTSGFLGGKPADWTHWVLSLMGHDPAADVVTDLFTGSGAVAAAIPALANVHTTQGESHA